MKIPQEERSCSSLYKKGRGRIFCNILSGTQRNGLQDIILNASGRRSWSF